MKCWRARFHSSSRLSNTKARRAWGSVLLLCAMLVACGTQPTSEPTSKEEPTPIASFTAPPQPTPTVSVTIAQERTQTVTPELSATQTPVLLQTETLAPLTTEKPAPPSPSPQAASWHASDVTALFLSGGETGAGLYGLIADGSTRLVMENIGEKPRISPDGRWLAFARWREDGRGAIVLHDALSDATSELLTETTSGFLRFAFDRESRRLAYLELGPVLSDGSVPWAIVVAELETGATARYEAVMVEHDSAPLPGLPLGWSSVASGADELILDTVVPYAEAWGMGVWGVTLPADGGSAPLDVLTLRQILSRESLYSLMPPLAPDGRTIGYLLSDPDYVPENYAPEFQDFAVNRLGVAELATGALTTLVEVSDGSALAHTLAWSPSSERLLFARGHYDGEHLANLTLLSTDHSGRVASHGSLDSPPSASLLELAWCGESTALYRFWSGATKMQHLYRFDLDSGIATETASAQRIEIVGCVP